MTLPKFNNSLTIGNILTIVMIVCACLATILQAVEHQKNKSVHIDRTEIVTQSEISELRDDMKDGFKEQREREDEHFQMLIKRIDGFYQ